MYSDPRRRFRSFLGAVLVSGAAAALAGCARPPGHPLVTDPDFSLVVLPDTQYYSKTYPSVYTDQTSWIAERREQENIRFVLHMGDITYENTEEQWARASQAHAILDSAGIPYSVLPGNHDYPSTDQGGLSRNPSLFNSTFGPSRFLDRSWYGGHYGSGNESSYQLFEVGSLEFLVVNLEYAPRKDVLCWARDLIDSHPDRRVLIATHCYQSVGGDHVTGCATSRQIIGSGGDAVWRELAQQHNNVFLVLSGHMYDTEYRWRDGGTAGHVVNEILTDYQGELPGGTGTPGGNGWLRLLRFRPSANRVEIATETVVQPGNSSYDQFFPEGITFYLTTHYSGDPTASDHQFSFDYDMTSLLPAHDVHSEVFQPFNDRTVNSAGTGRQSHPSVVTSRTGRSVVAWQDDRDGNGIYNIFARGFDSSGCEGFHDIAVNTDAGGQQINPAVASDADGNFVVVWQDDRNNDGKYDLYMRGFHADGSEHFAQTRVDTAEGGQHRNPKVAMDNVGNFVVVWEDDQAGKGYYSILARGFDASGAERIGQFAVNSVNSVASAQRINPAVAMNGAGEFVVAWEDDQDGNNVYNIAARGFDARGTERIAQFTVNSATDGQQRHPAVGIDEDGDFVVAWEDDQDGNGYYNILARGFYAGGTERITQFKVNSATDGQQNSPQVAMEAKGAFVVTWSDDQDGDGSYEIMARGFEPDGAQRFADQVVNAGTNGQQQNAAVAMDGAGNFVVAWEDDIDGNGVYEIVARGLNPAGGKD